MYCRPTISHLCLQLLISIVMILLLNVSLFIFRFRLFLVHCFHPILIVVKVLL